MSTPDWDSIRRATEDLERRAKLSHYDSSDQTFEDSYAGACLKLAKTYEAEYVKMAKLYLALLGEHVALLSKSLPDEDARS